MLSLAESPTGLVHLIRPQPSGRAHTRCGREADWDTWTRIRTLDARLGGQTLTSIREMVEMPVCDRCFN